MASLFQTCVKIIIKNIPSRKYLTLLGLPTSLVNSLKKCCGGNKCILDCIEHNHFNCFLYAYQYVCSFYYIKIGYVLEAIKYDNKNVFEYLLENDELYKNDDFFHHERAFIYAIKYDRLEYVIYLHEIAKYKWNNHITSYTAHKGNLSILKYLYTQNCPWNISTTTSAAENGKLECLLYAHEHGCPLDINCLINASSCNDIDCLIYVHKHGCILTEEVMNTATTFNNLNAVVYLHENNCPWSANTMSCAIHNLACLQYLYENNCPWDYNVGFFFQDELWCWDYYLKNYPDYVDKNGISIFTRISDAKLKIM